MANPVIDEILRQGRNQPRRRVLAALVTGRVESNFKNLGDGDADSAGWRQERASLYRNPTNLKASVRRFYQEAAKLDRGQRVGELAADVQRPRAEFRGRYAQHVGEAKRLLGSGGATGGTRGTPGTPGRAGAVSLGDPGTAVNVAAALSASANEEAPTATAPTLPAILTPKGYTPVSPGVAPTPRPKLTDALAKLSSLTDSDSTISGTAGRPGRAGTPGGGGGVPKSGSQVKELIYNDGGKGFGIKDGQTVDGASFYSTSRAPTTTRARRSTSPATRPRCASSPRQSRATSAAGAEVLATVSEIAEVAPWAFVLGVGVGFVIGARYRIEKRNGGDDGE
jgi:hypothetical protein